jgi:hypothetical protein
MPANLEKRFGTRIPGVVSPCTLKIAPIDMKPRQMKRTRYSPI